MIEANAKRREYMRAYLKTYEPLYKMRLKIEVLTHYGNGKCACVQCGFDDIRALSIDHIKEIHRKWRTRNGNSGTGTFLYRQLRRENYPEGYQTLCMNCQWLKQWELLCGVTGRYESVTKALQGVTGQ